MKKISIALFALVLFSCASNDNKTTEGTKTTTEAGVQNVNGNIPDTTNSINLSTHKTDANQKSKDSVK